MKWFDKWFAKKCKQAWEDENSPEDDDYASIPVNRYNTVAPKQARRLVATTASESLQSTGVTFALYNANGGYVIELREYDQQSDRFKNSLHVVPTGQELGKTLEHIITLEALKK